MRPGSSSAWTSSSARPGISTSHGAPSARRTPSLAASATAPLVLLAPGQLVRIEGATGTGAGCAIGEPVRFAQFRPRPACTASARGNAAALSRSAASPPPSRRGPARPAPRGRAARAARRRRLAGDQLGQLHGGEQLGQHVGAVLPIDAPMGLAATGVSAGGVARGAGATPEEDQQAGADARRFRRRDRGG
jgi:hypothetical protein